MSAGAAIKVGRTLQAKLRAIASGRVKGVELALEASAYLRAVTPRHVIIFRVRADVIQIVRIVHGAQDLEAIAADLVGKP